MYHHHQHNHHKHHTFHEVRVAPCREMVHSVALQVVASVGRIPNHMVPPFHILYYYASIDIHTATTSFGGFLTSFQPHL